MTAVVEILEDMATQAVVPVRVEPCACGGHIVAADLTPMIAMAVAEHVRCTLHLLWAHRNGFIAQVGTESRRQR